MDALLSELGQCGPDHVPEGFRLCANPFFLKFCSRVVFNPDDRGLFSGIYLPLDLWKCLHSNGRLKGPQGDVVNFGKGRKLSNSQFIELVANSWVGTTIPQSAELAKVIRPVLESGRTVTFAVKHLPTSDDAEQTNPTAPLDVSPLRFDDDPRPDDWLNLEDVVDS